MYRYSHRLPGDSFVSIGSHLFSVVFGPNIRYRVAQ